MGHDIAYSAPMLCRYMIAIMHCILTLIQMLNPPLDFTMRMALQGKIGKYV